LLTDAATIFSDFSELKIKIVAGEFNTMTVAFPYGKTEYVLYISIRRITEAGGGVRMGDGAEGMRSDLMAERSAPDADRFSY
jgi:hypothetical protein